MIDIQPKPTKILDDFNERFPNANIIYFQTDITFKVELEATFNAIREIFPSIDILINTAGIFNDKNVELTFKVNVVSLVTDIIFLLLFFFSFFILIINFQIKCVRA